MGRDLARPFDGADPLDPAERGEEPRLPPPGWNKASAESRYPGGGSGAGPRCDAIRCKSAALVLLFLVGAEGAEIHPSSRSHTLSFTLTLCFSSSGCRTLVSRLRLLLAATLTPGTLDANMSGGSQPSGSKRSKRPPPRPAGRVEVWLKTFRFVSRSFFSAKASSWLSLDVNH